MNEDEMLQLFTKEQRIDITLPGYRRKEAGQVIRLVSLTDEDGFILYSDLTEGQEEEAIVEQMIYYQQLNQRFEWKVYDYDKPTDLKERLHAHSFEIGEREATMVLQLNAANPLLACTLPSSIRPVTDEAGIDAIVLLEEAVWGVSHAELGKRMKRDLLHNRDQLQIYAAYDHDKMVSTAWMYLHDGTSFGSLWGGSTLPDYRKQGLYSALLAARAKVAWRAGFHLLMVDASPMSCPILKKKGFDTLAYTWPCLSPEQ